MIAIIIKIWKFWHGIMFHEPKFPYLDNQFIEEENQFIEVIEEEEPFIEGELSTEAAKSITSIPLKPIKPFQPESRLKSNKRRSTFNNDIELFLILVLLFHLPLIILPIIHGRYVNLIIFVLCLAVSFVLFLAEYLPLALHIPILATFISFLNHDIVSETFTRFLESFGIKSRKIFKEPSEVGLNFMQSLRKFSATLNDVYKHCIEHSFHWLFLALGIGIILFYIGNWILEEKKDERINLVEKRKKQRLKSAFLTIFALCYVGIFFYYSFLEMRVGHLDIYKLTSESSVYFPYFLSKVSKMSVDSIIPALTASFILITFSILIDKLFLFLEKSFKAIAIVTVFVFIGLLFILSTAKPSTEISYYFSGLTSVFIETFILSLGIMIGSYFLAKKAGILASISVISIGLIAPSLTINAWLLLLFLVVYTLSPTRKNKVFLVIVFSLITILITGNLNFGTTLIGSLIALISYYRILPDYIILCFVSCYQYLKIKRIIFDDKNINFLIRNKKDNLRKILLSLPPHSTGLIWLPLPKHESVLQYIFSFHPEAVTSDLLSLKFLNTVSSLIVFERVRQRIVCDQINKSNNSADLVMHLTPTMQLACLPIKPSYSLENLYRSSDRFNVVGALTIILGDLKKYASEYNDVSLKVRGFEGIAFQSIPKIIERCEKHIDLNDSFFYLLIALLLERKKNKDRPFFTHDFRSRLEYITSILKKEIFLYSNETRPFEYELYNPVKPESRSFVRRNGFAVKILKIIEANTSPNIVLHGPYRCGKTTLIKNLNVLLPEDKKIMTVYIDVSDGSVNESDAKFLETILRCVQEQAIVQSLIDKSTLIPELSEFRDQIYSLFNAKIEELLSGLAGFNILICFDEFGEMAKAIQDKRITYTLLSHLRHLMQHNTQISLLFAGIDTLDVIAPEWSQYFNNTISIEMVYLEQKEAKGLIDALSNPKHIYDDDVIDEIVKQTRCQPMLIQHIMSMLSETTNVMETDLITFEILERSIDLVLDSNVSLFTGIWDKYTTQNYSSEEQQKRERKKGRRLLLSLSHDIPVPLGPLERKLLKRLQHYHVLDKNFNFEIPMVKKWVGEYATEDE